MKAKGKINLSSEVFKWYQEHGYPETMEELDKVARYFVKLGQENNELE